MDNHDFLEGNTIVAGFINGDINADVNADYVSLANYDRCLVLFIKPAGSAADDVSIKLTQAADNAADGDKALNFTRLYHKVGLQTGVASWSRIAFTTTDDVDTVSVGADNTDLAGDTVEMMLAVEVKNTDLDADGGFTHFRLEIEGDDIGNALVTSCLYLMLGARHSQATNVSAIA